MPRWRLVFTWDDVYTEKVKRIHKLTQDVEEKIDNIPGVVDDANSDSTTDALSAHMGKVLQDQITELKWVWTYMSGWDCTTWLPLTDPQVDPYTYKPGNYYIVAKVWATNYKPHWNIYNQWVPSTAIETENVSVNDWYMFDWSNWVRQPAWERAITVDDALSPTSTNPVENRVINSALATKQAVITDLSTIRAWAAAWATALQPWANISELTNNLNYQTEWEVNTAIANATAWLATTTSVNALADRVTTNEWDISDIKSDITDIQWDITTINETLTRDLTPLIWLDQTVSDLADDVTDLQWDVSALETTVSWLEWLVDWWVVYKWATPPANPSDWELWYNTNTQVLNIYNATTQTWGPVDTNTTYTAGAWLNLTNNQFAVDYTTTEKKIQLVTQDEYDNLPESKLTDWVDYFIYTTS